MTLDWEEHRRDMLRLMDFHIEQAAVVRRPGRGLEAYRRGFGYLKTASKLRRIASTRFVYNDVPLRCVHLRVIQDVTKALADAPDQFCVYVWRAQMEHWFAVVAEWNNGPWSEHLTVDQANALARRSELRPWLEAQIAALRAKA